MSRFFSNKFASLTPYTPGEQPQEKKYIKLNTNESPYSPSPLAQRLVREAAGDVRLYPDPRCRSLVETAAKIFDLAPDELLFTNGSDDILNFAFMAFCDKEHPAVFPDITYGFYPVFAKLNGVPYKEIPLGEDFTVNVEDYIGVGRTIFLANPNAPTGIALPAREIERIIVSNPDSVVVVDEAYIDFGGESVLPLIRKYDNLLVCRTFSKSRSLAGGRLGFGAACPSLIADLNTLKYSTNPYNINRLTMAAGIGALTDSSYFEENLRKIIHTRSRVSGELKAMGFAILPSSANFIFIKHPKIGGMELYLSLKENGILVRHFETPRLRDHNRITIGSDSEMDAFLTETKKILEGKI